MSSHWSNYDSWNYVAAPLRPCETIIDQYKSIIGKSKSTLLLGCTQELCILSEKTTAVDYNQSRIDNWWPNTENKIAICGNWFNLCEILPENNNKFDFILGDGSFTFLNGPKEWEKVLNQCKRVLNQDGMVIIRVYETPSEQNLMKNIKNSVISGEIPSFDCLKLEIMYKLSCQGTKNIPVRKIRSTFYELFDKKELSEQTGWSMDVINVIDAYEHSDDSYYLPTRSQIKLAFPEAIRVGNCNYPFAETCAFYVF